MELTHPDDRDTSARRTDAPAGNGTRASFTTLAAVAVMTWCLTAAAYNLSNPGRSRHAIAELDAQFATLIPYLPRHGEVGFLQHYQEPDTEDAVRTWYIAQYALSPRIVVSRLGPEFVIVANGTADPAGEQRLDGYARVLTSPGGHRLYRRLLQ